MIYRRLIIVALLFAFGASFNPAEAQLRGLRDRIKDRAKDRVERRVENEINKKVDAMVDGALDRGFNALERDFNKRQEKLEIKDNETGPADAPLIRYRQVESMLIPGMGNATVIMSMLNRESVDEGTVVTVSSTMRREDNRSEASSTLFNAETGTYTYMDHASKTYTVMSLDEMMAYAAEQLEAAEAELEEAMGEMEEARAEANQAMSETDVELTFKVEETNRSERINGVQATQYLLILQADTETTMQDENGQTQTRDGTHYTVTEMWLSKDIAGYETMRAFERTAGETAYNAIQNSEMNNMGDLMANYTQDARSGPALERMSDEMTKLEEAGFAVRTTVHMVMVPAGEELDIVQMLADADADDENGGLSSFVNQAGQANNTQGVAEQFTMLRMSTDVGDLTMNVDEAVFTVPGDYTRTEGLPGMGD